jgi:hypothetical protein
MGFNKYMLVVLWYFLPFLYLLIEGVYLPTSGLILTVFLGGLSFGYFSANSFHIDRPARHGRFLTDTFYFIFVITALLQLYGFFRIYVDGVDVSSYRDEFYESAGGVFKSTYLYTLYTVFMVPIFLIGTMYMLNADFKTKATKALIITAFLVIILDGVLRFGRFQYLFVLFFLYLTYRKFGLSRLSLLLGVVVTVVVSFVTIYFRQFYNDAAITSGLALVNKSIIQETITKYQFVGYIFLDHLTEGKSLLGHPLEFNTLSFFQLFLKTITSKVGFDFTYSWEHYNLLLSEGMYEPKLDVFFNAFSTNFLPIYLDFGVIGIFVYGLVSGSFIGIKTSNQVLRTIQFLNFFVLFFGLYQPIITTLLGFVLIIAYAASALGLIKTYKQIFASHTTVLKK